MISHDLNVKSLVLKCHFLYEQLYRNYLNFDSWGKRYMGSRMVNICHAHECRSACTYDRQLKPYTKRERITAEIYVVQQSTYIHGQRLSLIFHHLRSRVTDYIVYIISTFLAPKKAMLGAWAPAIYHSEMASNSAGPSSRYAWPAAPKMILKSLIIPFLSPAGFRISGSSVGPLISLSTMTKIPLTQSQVPS